MDLIKRLKDLNEQVAGDRDPDNLSQETWDAISNFVGMVVRAPRSERLELKGYLNGKVREIRRPLWGALGKVLAEIEDD